MTLAIYVVIFSVLPCIFVACLAAFIPTTFEVEDDDCFAWHEEARTIGWFPAYVEDYSAATEEEIAETILAPSEEFILVDNTYILEETPLSPTQVPTIIDGREIMSLAAKEGFLDDSPIVFDRSDWNNPLEEIEYGSDESVFFVRREENDCFAELPLSSW